MLIKELCIFAVSWNAYPLLYEKKTPFEMFFVWCKYGAKQHNFGGVPNRRLALYPITKRIIGRRYGASRVPAKM
jgi:hypothetical protein